MLSELLGSVNVCLCVVVLRQLFPLNDNSNTCRPILTDLHRISNFSWLDECCCFQTADLFVFVALRPKSTAMVIAGRSVHLTTLFPGQS